MDLKSLFSDVIKLELTPKLRMGKTQLKKLIKDYPKELFSLIIDLQDEGISQHSFILPCGTGELIFKVENEQLDITYHKVSKKRFNDKFKRLLGQVYDDIQEEDKHNDKITNKKNSADKGHTNLDSIINSM